MAQFAQDRFVGDLQRDDLNELPEQVVNNHVGGEPHNDRIDEKRRMPQDESSNESGYSRPSHDHVRSLIRKGL